MIPTSPTEFKARPTYHYRKIVIDDWEPRTGPWLMCHKCHCGHTEPVNLPVHNVCPNCGCTDQWRKVITRFEWEFSKTLSRTVIEPTRNRHRVELVKCSCDETHRGDIG